MKPDVFLKSEVSLNNILMKITCATASIRLLPLPEWAVLEQAQVFLTRLLVSRG